MLPPKPEVIFATTIIPYPTRAIYFAGKIAKNCWRHSIVDGLRGFELPENPANAKLSFGDGRFVCTGPFFSGCDHGCSHGEATHGAGAGGDSNCGGEPSPRAEVFARCMLGIAQADTIFAWIDQEYHAAYGTLIELGHAHHAGKNIVLGVHPSLSHEREIWFLRRLANSVVIAKTAKQAFALYEKRLSLAVA